MESVQRFGFRGKRGLFSKVETLHISSFKVNMCSSVPISFFKGSLPLSNALFQRPSSSVQHPFSKVLFLCPIPLLKGCVLLSQSFFWKVLFSSFNVSWLALPLFQRFSWLPQEFFEDLLEVVFSVICTSSLASSFASVMACTAVFKTSWIAFKLASGASTFPKVFFLTLSKKLPHGWT